MWMTVFSDMGTSLIVLAHGLRLLKKTLIDFVLILCCLPLRSSAYNFHSILPARPSYKIGKRGIWKSI